MDYSLSFVTRYEYSTLESGINVPVALRLGAETAPCDAKIDTGAQVCLFRRELGELLGIEIESGHRLGLDSLGGSLTAYGHSVTLQVLGVEDDSIVYFAATYDLPRNLLGREGWLQKVRLAVVDYDAALYLSPYDYV
jgi:hypothetical protein